MKLIALLLILLSSCSQLKYGVDISAQKMSYEESSPSQTLLISNNAVRIPSVTLTSKGFGGRIGITEESKYLLTKISYYKSEHSNDNYWINNNKLNMTLEESGLEGLIAWKLYCFRVFGSVTKGTQDFSVESSDSKVSGQVNYVGFGYGLGLELPMSENTFFYVSMHKKTIYDEYDIVTKRSHGLLSVGLRFNLFTIEGSNPF